MALVGPISNDEWDRSEPLVGGVPLYLRTILFCHWLLLIGPLAIFVGLRVGVSIAFPESDAGRLQQEPGEAAYWYVGALFVAWHVASLVRAYRLSRWALLSLAVVHALFGILLFVAAILYGLDWGVLVGLLYFLLGLCFLKVAFYLLRLEAWVRKEWRR